MVLNNFSSALSTAQNKTIGLVSEFYKCLHKRHEIVNQDNICFINKELFEKFKSLQPFIFRENNQFPIENKINYWIGFRKKWYYWLCLLFIFGELRLHFLKKQLPEHKDNNNLDSVLNSFFSKLKPLRCFYSTMDMLAPKNLEAENISVNELLLRRKDIFKFKIITPKENRTIQNGMVGSVYQTQFGGKNYFYKKMDVCEQVPNTNNEKGLKNEQKQNLSMGNYLGAKENDSVIIDPIFRQLAIPIIAKHFGFDNIIPMEIAFLKERENLKPVYLMEKAKGEIGYRIFLYYNKYAKEEAENYSKEYYIELFDASDPKLQIEALKLGIVDFIGLNPDRHAGNIFFIKTIETKFKLTGIDNDWCFLIKPPTQFTLDKFFEAKVPFITSNLKKEVLAKLNDTNGIEKLMAKLEGKINRGPGGKQVMEALENRIKVFKNYIEKCEVIDVLDDKTANKFIVQYDVTKDNPISAMIPVSQMLHEDKLYRLEKSKNQLTENNKPKTTTIEGKIIRS